MRSRPACNVIKSIKLATHACSYYRLDLLRSVDGVDYIPGFDLNPCRIRPPHYGDKFWHNKNQKTLCDLIFNEKSKLIY
jgi:hypothetical protein